MKILSIPVVQIGRTHSRVRHSHGAIFKKLPKGRRTQASVEATRHSSLRELSVRTELVRKYAHSPLADGLTSASPCNFSSTQMNSRSNKFSLRFLFFTESITFIHNRYVYVCVQTIRYLLHTSFIIKSLVKYKFDIKTEKIMICNYIQNKFVHYRPTVSTRCTKIL